MRSNEAESTARNSRHAASLIPFALMLDMSYRIAAYVILTLKEMNEPEAWKLCGDVHGGRRPMCYVMAGDRVILT